MTIYVNVTILRKYSGNGRACASSWYQAISFLPRGLGTRLKSAVSSHWSSKNFQCCNHRLCFLQHDWLSSNSLWKSNQLNEARGISWRSPDPLFLVRGRGLGMRLSFTGPSFNTTICIHLLKWGGYFHMPQLWLRSKCGQSAVNGQDGFLAAGQLRSKYHKTVALTVKVSFIPGPSSSFPSVACQCSQCCIVAVPFGWLKNKTWNEAAFDRWTEQVAHA